MLLFFLHIHTSLAPPVDGNERTNGIHLLLLISAALVATFGLATQIISQNSGIVVPDIFVESETYTKSLRVAPDGWVFGISVCLLTFSVLRQRMQKSRVSQIHVAISARGSAGSNVSPSLDSGANFQTTRQADAAGCLHWLSYTLVASWAQPLVRQMTMLTLITCAITWPCAVAMVYLLVFLSLVMYGAFSSTRSSPLLIAGAVPVHCSQHLPV
jgi:hypothetical protein